MIKAKKLSDQERDRIGILLAGGISLRDIARKLNRSVSTISAEISRNSRTGVYQPIAAHHLSLARNTASRRTNPLKSAAIYTYVIDKLRCGWSPEQIAGRLRRRDKGKTVICHETIYRYIYSSAGQAKHLSEYLARHHHKRRHWHSRYLYRRGIANRVSIRFRPEEINTRAAFGHWEGDVVEGKRHSGGIQTLLERKTRFYQALLMAKIDSEYGIRAQKRLLAKWPQGARQSVTFDNGRENYNHHQLRQDLGIDTYFCDPYCAWQKGANEHHNGILRRYIPKKADITQLTQWELKAIVAEINHRPRKCLGYETPSEAFRRELKSTKP